MTAKEWVVDWFVSKAGIARETVEQKSAENYFANSWLDSFAFIGFLSEIEGHFDIAFDNDDFTDRSFSTIDGLAEHITRKSAS